MDTEKLKSVLARLVEGENGTKQPSAVKRQLRALERAGLIRWTQTPGCDSSGAGGWFPTEEGRKLLGEEPVDVEKFIPVEVAYTRPGKSNARRVCKTRRALDKLLDKVREDGGKTIAMRMAEV